MDDSVTWAMFLGQMDLCLRQEEKREAKLPPVSQAWMGLALFLGHELGMAPCLTADGATSSHCIENLTGNSMDPLYIFHNIWYNPSR